MSQPQSYEQTLARFSALVREIIGSKKFSRNDLLAPMNALKHVAKDKLTSTIEECGAASFLKEAAESSRSLKEKTIRARINDAGFVQITTRDGDDLQIIVPSFREIVDVHVVSKDSEMYWVAVVFLYLNGEESILYHIAKKKIEAGLL